MNCTLGEMYDLISCLAIYNGAKQKKTQKQKITSFIEAMKLE